MKKLFAGGAVILGAAAVASLVTALPALDSYCTLCGARQETKVYAVRFTGSALFTARDVRATKFSALLEEKHLAGAHQHRWEAPHFVPNPLDEFGPPVFESLEFINAPRVVNFMRNVADYADPMSAVQWRETVLQPHLSYVIDDALRYLLVPANGFAEREQFLTWWGGNSYALSNRLREVTQPD